MIIIAQNETAQNVMAALSNSYPLSAGYFGTRFFCLGIEVANAADAAVVGFRLAKTLSEITLGPITQDKIGNKLYLVIPNAAVRLG